MKSSTELKDLLNRIDHRGYPAYKDTKGSYQFPDYIFLINHVQSDPFASPSKVEIQVKGAKAAFPKHLFDKKHKRIALQDYLTRQFHAQLEKMSFKAHGSGKSGLVSISRCRQEILERSACRIDDTSGDISVLFEIGFPANGRTIASHELIRLLFDYLPECVRKSLFYNFSDKNSVQKTAELAEDQEYIRQQLSPLGLVAFVANGSILPRQSGVSDRPMKNAVKFISPESMSVTLRLPNHGEITGMGIKKGISLIVGGGYHGKSTLLKALESGVYNHIAGDGREFVITDAGAMKLRAEDGRSVKSVDISMFINGLPNGKDTHAFSTEDASGSTSQAANVIEAMESGSRLFLIDEDTSATNFMIRDELMQQVVHRDSEPITPFIDRVCQVYEQFGISTIIVIGSSGSYFHKADCVIQMEQYKPKEITDFAKKQAQSFPYYNEALPAARQPEFKRCPKVSKTLAESERTKIKVSGTDLISVNRENIDMRLVEQIADSEQLTALGYILVYAVKNLINGKNTITQIVDNIMALTDKNGLAAICTNSHIPCNLAMPRRQEIFACLNRYRGLNM